MAGVFGNILQAIVKSSDEIASLGKSAAKKALGLADKVPIPSAIANSIDDFSRALKVSKTTVSELAAKLQKVQDETVNAAKSGKIGDEAIKAGETALAALKESDWWKANDDLFDDIVDSGELLKKINNPKSVYALENVSDRALQMTFGVVQKMPLKTSGAVQDGVFTFLKSTKNLSSERLGESLKYITTSLERSRTINLAIAFMKEYKWAIGLGLSVASITLLCIFTKKPPLEAITDQLGKAVVDIAKAGGTALGEGLGAAAGGLGAGANNFLDSSGLSGLFKGMGTYIMIGVAVVFMMILFMMLK
jgi:hypothetical protein